MKSLLVGFVLLVSFSFQVGLTQAETETDSSTDTQAKTQTQATASNTNNGCHRKPFTLARALGHAQQVGSYSAVVPNGLPGSNRRNQIDNEGALVGFAALLQRITNGLTMIAAAVAVFFLVFNAGSLLLAVGDSEAIKKARTGILWALLGLLLIMGSYIIAKTAISLTYSGSSEGVTNQRLIDVHDDCGENQEDQDGETENAQETAATDYPTQNCPSNPSIPSLPASCYTGSVASTQSGVNGAGTGGSCDDRINSQNQLGGVCSSLGISGSCTINAVQGVIDYGKLGDSFPASCRQKDGKYGQCTIEAIRLHYQRCAEQTN